MRLAFAILVGRLVGALSRLLGRGASAVPGLVVEWIDPRAIERLVARLPGGVTVVTGTNGKTTTTKMIVSILESRGRRVLTNRTGSNLARGVATALIGSASLSGRVAADSAVFEVDEAAVRSLSPRLMPRAIVVTNLARDQLDRYGELRTTAEHIRVAIAHADLGIFNADDPLVADLAAERPAAWFGGADDIRAAVPDDRSLYGGAPPEPTHRPALDLVVLSSRPQGDGQRAVVRVDGADLEVALGLPGVYNAYNAAAALLVTARLGVSPADAVAALEAMAPAFGRGQVVDYRGRRVKLLLVKNPASFNQAIHLLRELPVPAGVLVAINDEHADGRDVSWLWDARVDELAGTGHRFGAGGVRAADMALRFKYAGIAAWTVEDFAEALDRLVLAAEPGESVYLVPTYTAMLRFLDLLVPGASKSEVWR